MKFALLLLSLSLISTHSFAQDVAGTTSAPSSTDSTTVSTPAPTTDTTVTPPSSSVSSTDSSSTEVKKGDPKIIKMIEDKFNLSADDIAKYRADKLGYGQIMLMAEFAKTSGKSMDEVVALLQEKKSVKEVAKELKLTKGDMDKIRKEMRTLLHEERKDKKEERKDKHDKKDKKEDRREDKREERREEKKEERREDRKEEKREDRQDERRSDRHRK